MRKLLMWFWLLNKRLYKKATFIFLLALIPIVVLALSVVSQQDSGFITVALGQKDRNDEISSAIVNELMDDSQLIRFLDCTSAEEAIDNVVTGKADAAWIFPENMQESVDKFMYAPAKRNSFVQVIERQETVPLMVSHEKLSGILYKYCAKNMYINFIRNNVEELGSLSDEQLLTYYNDFEMDGELFEFSYPESSAATENTKNINYLMSPVRGLLSVIAVLCGLAAAIFSIQDEQNGVFAWVKQSKRVLVSFGCQAIAILNVSVVMFASVIIVGMNVSILRETVMLFAFVLCSTVFCMLLKTLFKSIKVLGSITPLLVVLMVAICPVFFDLNSLRVFQYLFPPTYYINSAFSNDYLIYSLIYSVIGIALTFVFRKMLKRQ